MLKATLLSLITQRKDLTTYKVGLLQTKAYRILKQRTALALVTYDLSTIEWALLGMLFEHPEGLRSIEIAEFLGVEAPFVTVMIAKLEKQKLVARRTSKNDKRAKIVSLSIKGKKAVPKIDTDLRQQTKYLLHGLNPLEILTYLKVLTTMVSNGSQNYFLHFDKKTS